MRRVKRGTGDLFEQQTFPLIDEFRPSPEDWLIGQHSKVLTGNQSGRFRCISCKVDRDPRRLYGVKRVNARLQKTLEQTTETMLNHQEIRNTLRKLKSLIEETAEENADESEARP
jgi:hypothetical protein